jgi:hypothetical protein
VHRPVAAVARDGAAGEGDHAAPVAENVGHRRDGDDRVERGVEARPVGERRGHEAAAIDDTDDVAIPLDAVLVAHRPPRRAVARQFTWRMSSSGE